MPPRRSKRSSPAKKAAASADDDTKKAKSSKRTKTRRASTITTAVDISPPSESPLSVEDLYQKCLVGTMDSRRMALAQADQRGVLRSFVWPQLVTMKHDDKNWTRACWLVAALLDFEQQLQQPHESDLHALDFCKDDPEVWTAFLDTLCSDRAMTNTNDTDVDGGEADTWEQRTMLIHVLDIAWCGSADDPALQAAVAPHMTVSWPWIPARYRELQWRLRYNKPYGEEKESSQQQPYILCVITQIMHMVQGERLALGVQARKQAWATEHWTEDPKEQEEEKEERAKDYKLPEWTFLHRALELLIDLLSAKNRGLLKMYLDAIHFTVECRQALGTSTFSAADENMLLTQQLLERVTTLCHFPIDDKGQALTPVQVVTEHHRRATVLQKMGHRYYEHELQDVVHAGVGLVCRPPFVRNAVAGLSNTDLLDLLYKMRLVDKNNGGQGNHAREFLLQVLEEYLTIPPDPLEQLQSFPLYPTEAVLWDFAQIPPSHASLLPVSNVLALPKLQTHYLGFADYLWRNFTLLRLESAYEIRSDLVDVIRRVRPLLRQSLQMDNTGNEEMVLKTEFSGWARMALELQGHLELTKVAKPLLGHAYPAQVVAEITVDLGPCGDAIRREWDDLGEFDNLFLVAIDASKMNGQLQAPLLRDYHLQHAYHQPWDTDSDRRVPDEDDRTFPQRMGVTLVRGCMILQVKDEGGTILSEPGSNKAEPGQGTKRTFRVALDPTQYSLDAKSPAGTDMYQSFNLVVRRHGRENNFKAILETIRGLMAGAGAIKRVIPPWLQPVLLGQGDPTAACYQSSTMQEYATETVGVANPDDPLDYGDTFLNEEHLRASFPDVKVVVDGRQKMTKKKKNETERRHNYRVRAVDDKGKTTMEATSYPFPQGVKGNPVRFTPRQVEAIRSGLSPGLTMVVGPPGTGKTDVAVQIIASLYHSFPTQRTIVITHSNAALNDIFQKVMSRGDVDERYLVRLGAGERELQTESTHDFTKAGRVAYSFARRGELLEQVQQLSESLGLSGKAERGADGSPSYTCETAEYFYEYQVQKRIRAFDRQAGERDGLSDDTDVTDIFPFTKYFKMDDETITMAKARECFSRLDAIFAELAEYRPLELLRSQRQRTDYLIMKQARVVAMTCTHAAIARSHLIKLGFEYDNVVIEEAGQMMEIETFIPLLLQRGEADESSGSTRLKRVCLMGDHNQLPPVIKNMSFAKYSNLDQSLFSRLIHFGVPYIQLDKQGRARPEIATLYSWRYEDLGNLDHVQQLPEFRTANPGFANTFQIINVESFQGKGESSPTAYFYQNVGEAEYAIALFQYMVLIGYPPEKISILTTYNGQKALISDILGRRCGQGTPMAGVRPRAVSTVDQYQGQQNDYVILSLVRTESVGHLRDIRRLVVAVSRSRLGLYVLCRQELFASCYELKRTMDQFADRLNKLQLVLGETYPIIERQVDDEVPSEKLFEVDDVAHLGTVVHSMQEDLMSPEAVVDTA